MAVTSKRERALQVVLVVLGLLTAGTNINALVTSLRAGLRPTGGTTAPMFYTTLATLGVFLVLAARNPSAHRSLIAYAVWSSFAHTAVMALMAIQLPTRRGELLAGMAVTGLAAVLLFVLARSSAGSEGAVPV
jgi:tryptophan-rich sensory protein